MRQPTRPTSLPQHIRADPSVLQWEIDQLANQLDDHSERLEALERSPLERISDAASLPIGKMVGLGGLGLLAALGHLSPEQTKDIIAKLIGVDW